MPLERPFEAWKEIHRQGQDIVGQFIQGFGVLCQDNSNSISCSRPNSQKLKFFDLELPCTARTNFGIGQYRSIAGGVSAIFEAGNRLGKAGVEIGACLNDAVQHFLRGMSLQFRQEMLKSAIWTGEMEKPLERQKEKPCLSEDECSGRGFLEPTEGLNRTVDNANASFTFESFRHSRRSEGTFSITSIYDSMTGNIKSSLIAKGDLWRMEASHDGSSAENGNSSLFFIQLGPVLFVRETTLLLPVHLSKENLFWYGFDRKSGAHSLCPAFWSKDRRWQFTSMFCLNPLACSFVDMQFPYGQFTYTAGERVTASTFLPLLGGLLQAAGQYPGEAKISFSFKNKWGTRITQVVQFPDTSFSLSLDQALAWCKSGFLMRPTAQFSVSPTFGGSDHGVQAKLTHSVNDQLALTYGCTYAAHATAFASATVGSSMFNGNAGSTGMVFNVEAPLFSTGRPSLSVQLNYGVDF